MRVFLYGQGARYLPTKLARLILLENLRISNYHLAAGTGTHLDAPSHCAQQGKSVADFRLEELIGVGCVINVSVAVHQNPDYQITMNDIMQWEKDHGQIPRKAIILAYTGWSQYWKEPHRYCNADENGILHFPGFGKEAAELLVKRGIIGVGIDTLSLDPGTSQTYPAHHIFLNHGLFQLENVANIQALPAVGSTIFVLPLKIEQGPEAPARVFAICEADAG